MDRKLKDAGFDGVYADNIRDIFMLTGYLIKKEKKDITVITGDLPDSISQGASAPRIFYHLVNSALLLQEAAPAFYLFPDCSYMSVWLF